MVTTEARTKPSKRFSISCTSLVFSIATAAWAASARMSATSAWPKDRTWAFAASAERIRAWRSSFRLMSCSTPITCPERVAIGAVRTERVW